MTPAMLGPNSLGINIFSFSSILRYWKEIVPVLEAEDWTTIGWLPRKLSHLPPVPLHFPLFPALFSVYCFLIFWLEGNLITCSTWPHRHAIPLEGLKLTSIQPPLRNPSIYVPSHEIAMSSYYLRGSGGRGSCSHIQSLSNIFICTDMIMWHTNTGAASSHPIRPSAQ